MEDLVRAWRALLAPHTTSPNVDAAGQALLACWAEPHRRYHDLEHLRGVLSAIDDLEQLAEDPDAVRLAAWYHDAVYAGRSDDEELSAVMAEQSLSALGLPAEFVAEVGRLIRMTVEHNPAADDSNGAVLSDADLAVLALPRADYQRNSAAVRAEYAHVPGGLPGRAGPHHPVAAGRTAPVPDRYGPGTVGAGGAGESCRGVGVAELRFSESSRRARRTTRRRHSGTHARRACRS